MTDFADTLGTIGTSEEQIELMDVATSFCREHGGSAAARALIESEVGYDPDVWAKMAELGWLAVAVPEAHGGVGLGIAEAVPIAEQLGRNLIASPFAATQAAIQTLLSGASAAQQAEWLPRLAAGEAASSALHEDHGDWDLHNVTATGEVAGEMLHLTGRKQLVLWADAAALILTTVRVDGAVRIAAIPAEALPAGALRREGVIEETVRSFELTLDSIALPADALLPAERTAATLERAALVSALLQGAEMTGGTQAVIDYTVDYLNTRKQFGKLIGSFQALKHPIVDAYVGYEKARTLLYSAAHCIDDQGRGEVAVRMAAAQICASYSHAADRSIQFHGAFGFTHDADSQLYRRQAIFRNALIGDAAYHRGKLADLLFG
jgi:alkylation response protein AidB-like acyl-CoA dehydrogenase